MVVEMMTLKNLRGGSNKLDANLFSIFLSDLIFVDGRKFKTITWDALWKCAIHGPEFITTNSQGLGGLKMMGFKDTLFFL